MNRERPVNGKVMATLLLAALACVADVPCIAALVLAPDTVGAQRALDLVQASRLQQRLSTLPADEADALASRMDRDRESAQALGSLPALQAVLPAAPRLPRAQAADLGPAQPQGLPVNTESSPALLWPAQLLHLPPPGGQPPALHPAAVLHPMPAGVRGRAPPAAA
ncbi:MAG: hypothetical protein IT463_10400 [Planctomycetes bacterium]|nr:hypothetical protein [Planctomycetota bacterium]